MLFRKDRPRLASVARLILERSLQSFPLVSSRQQSVRPDERGPEPTLEQPEPGVPSGHLSHQGPDGVLREGAPATAPRFRRLPRPLAAEERVSLRLLKVGFLERRGQGETGPAGAVFGKGG